MGPIHRDVETSCIETRARGQPGPTPDSNHRVTNTKGEFMTRYLHSDLGHPESPLSATRRSAGSADPFPARQVTTPHRTGASRPAPAPPPPIPSRLLQPPSRRRLRRSPPTAGGRWEDRKPGQAPELAGPTPGRPSVKWQQMILLDRPTPRLRRATFTSAHGREAAGGGLQLAPERTSTYNIE